MGESSVTKEKNTKMKKILEYLDLKTILIIALIILVLFMRMCEGSGEESDVEIVNIDGKKYEVVKHEIDTIIVPVEHTVFKEGKTIYRDTVIYVEIPSNVDTGAILKAYFSKVVYQDTLKLKDSLGYIAIRDTITRNSILNRYFDAKVNKTTIKETLIVKEPAVNQLYIGGVAGFDKTNIVNFLGPNFTLKTKEDKMYSLGVGYGLNNNISVQAGMSWKISLKKKTKKNKKKKTKKNEKNK